MNALAGAPKVVKINLLARVEQLLHFFDNFGVCRAPEQALGLERLLVAQVGNAVSHDGRDDVALVVLLDEFERNPKLLRVEPPVPG